MLNLRYHFTFPSTYSYNFTLTRSENVAVTKLFQLTATVLSRNHRNGIMHVFISHNSPYRDVHN